MTIFGAPKPIDDAHPTPERLAKAKALHVQNSKGESIPFREVLNNRPTVLVLIRHNHCGFCVSYCAALASQPAFAATAGKSEGPQVIILGHGGWKGIDRYREVSGIKFDMYVDTSKKVYEALGVTRTSLDAGDPKTWPKHTNGRSAASFVFGSIKEQLGSGFSNLFNGGSIAQLGAEFVIKADGEFTFTHRMRTTLDHTEVEELVKQSGLEPAAAAPQAETKPEAAPAAAPAEPIAA